MKKLFSILNFPLRHAVEDEFKQNYEFLSLPLSEEKNVLTPIKDVLTLDNCLYGVYVNGDNKTALVYDIDKIIKTYSKFTNSKGDTLKREVIQRLREVVVKQKRTYTFFTADNFAFFKDKGVYDLFFVKKDNDKLNVLNTYKMSKFKPNKRWTEDEEYLLLHTNYSNLELEKILGRSSGSISVKKSDLRKKGAEVPYLIAVEKKKPVKRVKENKSKKEALNFKYMAKPENGDAIFLKDDKEMFFKIKNGEIPINSKIFELNLNEVGEIKPGFHRINDK